MVKGNPEVPARGGLKRAVPYEEVEAGGRENPAAYRQDSGSRVPSKWNQRNGPVRADGGGRPDPRWLLSAFRLERSARCGSLRRGRRAGDGFTSGGLFSQDQAERIGSDRGELSIDEASG